MTSTLRAALSGDRPVEILRTLVGMGIPSSDIPQDVRSDNKDRIAIADWVERWAVTCKVEVMATWSDGAWIAYDRDTIVKLSKRSVPVVPEKVLGIFSGVPFELCSIATLHPSWFNGTLDSKYRAPSFADLHHPHGWACVFKGKGHDRLVSRRWLDFGPWRVVRGADDTTLVEFHDPEADARTALEQARPGHQRMGISDEGGFIQSGFVYRHELEGRYFPERRVLDIVVHGRTVSQREMLDACAARLYQALGKDKPLDNVAYTFVREEEARAHLHELWLRGLECWAIIHGRETRLDLDYQPLPSPPDWVKQLEARPG